MRTIWKDVPEAVRPIAQRWLDMWAHLLPPWLDQLTIEWQDDHRGDGGAETSERYRIATVYLRVGFVGGPEREQELTIVHELLHVVHAPVQHVLERLIDDEKSFEHRTYEHALECFTSDLSIALVNERRARAERP